MKLLNLEELIKYHTYHVSTFAKFADVTTDLLEAAMREEGELTIMELSKISHYAAVPLGVLTCPKLIMLRRDRYRHCQMIQALHKKLYLIYETSRNGSKAAEFYMKYRRGALVSLLLDFQNLKTVSYCRYLGVKEEIDQTLLSIQCEEKKPRARNMHSVVSN